LSHTAACALLVLGRTPSTAAWVEHNKNMRVSYFRGREFSRNSTGVHCSLPAPEAGTGIREICKYRHVCVIPQSLLSVNSFPGASAPGIERNGNEEKNTGTAVFHAIVRPSMLSAQKTDPMPPPPPLLRCIRPRPG